MTCFDSVVECIPSLLMTWYSQCEGEAEVPGLAFQHQTIVTLSIVEG